MPTWPRIFVTNFNPRVTGVSTTASALVRAHRASGFQVDVVGNRLAGCGPALSISEAIRESRQTGGARTAIWHTRRTGELSSALFLRDVLRLPVHVLFTSAAIRRRSWPLRFLMSRTDGVIATSPEAASFVPKTIAVVPHGVDTSLFRPAADRNAAWKELGYPGQYGIATVGRIRPEKGTDRFVEAMISVLPELPGATALIAGEAYRTDKRFKAELQARVREAGLEDRFVFTGELPPDAMPRFMRGISLLVQLPVYEGFGMTVLEALASGTPFIATDAGSYMKFAEGGDQGEIVNGDTASVADAIRRFLPLSQSRVAAALEAGKAWSIDKEAGALGAVYRQMG